MTSAPSSPASTPTAPDLLVELRSVTRAVYDVNINWKAFAWAPAFPAHFAASRDQMITAIRRAFERGRDEGGAPQRHDR